VTLVELVRDALRREPERPIIWSQGRWFSADWARRVADDQASALAAAGIGAGEPVALAPRSQPLGVAALLGLIAEGRDIYMAHPFQSPEAMAQAIVRLPVRAAVAAAEDFSQPVRAAMAAKGMAGVGLSEQGPAPVEGLERASGAPGLPRGSEPHFMVLSSGTTGPPKHFALTYRLFEPATLNASLFSQPSNAPKAADVPTILYYPLPNISGLMQAVMAFASGGSAVLLEKFDVHAWRDYIVRYRPARVSLPPAAFRMILEAEIPPEDLSSLKMAGTGSAALDPRVHRAFEARYGIPILIGYGATEFGGSAAAMTPELHRVWGKTKFGSAGRPVAGATIRTVNPQTGEPNPAGVEGVIEVLLPWVASDWIRTADIGVVDEDGFLFLRGRADGAIVRGGFKILPETVERALQTHPKVAAAAVVGVPDPRLGERPVAAVEAPPGVEPPTSDELMAHLRAQLLAPQIPTEIRIVQALPRTGSLKIAKAQVKALFGG
jgi:acyl-CoA synthetase (AMP-forming)/AMP-acid ligase II